MRREFNVVIERDVEGYYVASVPGPKGCYTQARALDKLLPPGFVRRLSSSGAMPATTRLTLTLLCLLAPLVAGADTLDVYGNLTGKTVLMPSALPRLPDAIVASLPSDKTNAIARIEKALSEQGLEVVQDGPHFVRVFRKAGAGFAHQCASARG